MIVEQEHAFKSSRRSRSSVLVVDPDVTSDPLGKLPPKSRSNVVHFHGGNSQSSHVKSETRTKPYGLKMVSTPVEVYVQDRVTEFMS